MSNNAPDRTGIESLRLEVNSRRIHYLKAGSGPPVVLVHGGASDSRDWIDTMTALSGRFTFYAPDLIGFGQSERNEQGYYLSDFSDFLLGFIEALQIQHPALVGHSFGARVCLDVARLNQAKIKKLVLIDASGLGRMSAFGSVLFAGFWAMRKVLRRPQPFPHFLAKEGENYTRVGNEELQNLQTPTLLVWKRLDPYMPLALARRAEKLIPGARLAVIDGYGHAPHKQGNIEEFRRILQDFLSDDSER